jgi:hypothetical protein
VNPAASVRGPRHVVRRVSAPVFADPDVRRLLESVEQPVSEKWTKITPSYTERRRLEGGTSQTVRWRPNRAPATIKHNNIKDFIPERFACV